METGSQAPRTSSDPRRRHAQTAPPCLWCPSPPATLQSYSHLTPNPNPCRLTTKTVSPGQERQSKFSSSPEGVTHFPTFHFFHPSRETTSPSQLCVTAGMRTSSLRV